MNKFLIVLTLLATSLGGIVEAAGASSACRAFEKRHGGPCAAGPERDGRPTWLVGDVRGLKPASGEPDPSTTSAAQRRIDLSALPGVTRNKTLAFSVDYANWGEPSAVRVWRNGEELTVVADAKGAYSPKPVALEPGANVFRVELRSKSGIPDEAYAVTHRLDGDEFEELAIARAYLEKVAVPLLGIDAGRMAFTLSRVHRGERTAAKSPSGLVHIAYRPWIDGVPVFDGRLSVLLSRDEKSGEVVPVGFTQSLPRLPKAAAFKGIDVRQARKLLADEYAGGAQNVISEPALHWRRGKDRQLGLSWLAHLWGASPKSDPTKSRDGTFTAARLWVDAKGKGTQYENLALEQFPPEPINTDPEIDIEDEIDGIPVDEGRDSLALSRIFDGPLDDLDDGLKLRPMPEPTYIQLDDVRTPCTMGPYANVANDAEAGFFLLIPVFTTAGTPICGDTDMAAEPDLFESEPGDTQIGSDADDAIEGWTAYYHTHRVAEFLREEVGFSHWFPGLPGLERRQVHVGVNPKFSANAFAVPQLISIEGEALPNRFGIFFGQERGYEQTDYDGERSWMAADFSRDRGTIYHEYGHTVLFAQGYLHVTGLDGAVHEGFADYVNRALRGGATEMISPLLLTGNGYDLDRKRFCGPALPGDERFASLDADDPRGSATDAHTTGQAFCQALALAEARLASVYGVEQPKVLRQVIDSAVDWTAGEGAEGFVGPILATAYAEAVFRPREVPTDHELRTALALHGLVDDPEGRVATMTLGTGTGAYRLEDTIDVTVASGVSGVATLWASLDAHGDEPCRLFIRNERTEQVGADVSTRWAPMSVSVWDLAAECDAAVQDPIQEQLWLHVATCDSDAVSCRSPDAEGLRTSGGSTIRIDLVP